MAIQTIEILRNYMTCEDEAVKNKYYNLLDSFYHKSEGKILHSISENAEAITLSFTDGNTATENTSVVIPKLPESQEISFITGLQNALDGKVDKVPGRGLSDENFSLAEKQKLGALENYVKPNSEDISYIDGLQDALDTKVAEEVGKGLSSNDFTDALKQKLDALNVRAEQIIDSGGNYNNLALTGNVIVFNNTDIQAIINGIEFSTYKKISLVNQSAFALRLNSESTNSDLNKQLKLPTNFALIDSGGSADMVYVENLNAWRLQSIFNTKYIPQHKNLTSKQVLLVNEQNETETEETSEFEVFRNFQSVAMSKSELNDAYPGVEEGFMVVCRQIDIIYKKTDINTGDWKPINMGPNVV